MDMCTHSGWLALKWWVALKKTLKGDKSALRATNWGIVKTRKLNRGRAASHVIAF